MQSTTNQQFEDNPASGDIPTLVMPESVLAYFRATGRVGGSAKSPAKARAARQNGKLGGRRRKRRALPPMSERWLAVKKRVRHVSSLKTPQRQSYAHRNNREHRLSGYRTARRVAQRENAIANVILAPESSPRRAVRNFN